MKYDCLSIRKLDGPSNGQHVTQQAYFLHLVNTSWIKMVQSQSEEQNSSVSWMPAVLSTAVTSSMWKVITLIYGVLPFLWQRFDLCIYLSLGSLLVPCGYDVFINIYKIVNGIINSVIPQFRIVPRGTLQFCPTWIEGSLNKFAISKWHPLSSNWFITALTRSKDSGASGRRCAR